MQLKRKRINKAIQTIGKTGELLSEETPQQIITDNMEAVTKEFNDSFQIQDINGSSQNQTDISKQEKSD
ncbi:TPA: hypothetical protein TYI30_001804 [Streptococcus suis]|nr:hypothetical protein [Streptococcus suis]